MTIIGYQFYAKKGLMKLDKTGMKFVDFEKYCKKCKYNNTAESDVPCWECLEQPVNYNSEKPIHFKERDEK